MHSVSRGEGVGRWERQVKRRKRYKLPVMKSMSCKDAKYRTENIVRNLMILLHGDHSLWQIPTNVHNCPVSMLYT